MRPDLKVERDPNGKLNISGLSIWSAVKGVVGYGSPPEGDTFTTEDLDEMAKAHAEVGNVLRPRIYPGHPLNATLKMLARPKGEITRLYRDGSELKADLKGVDADFWNKATADGARLSPDVKMGHLDQRTGKRYPLSVIGLGVLGAVQAANQLLPSLDDYAVNYYADSAQQRAYGGDSDIRSLAGPRLSRDMAQDSAWRPVLNALKGYAPSKE